MTTDIAIIGGCGHVGLPLGLAFARTGKRVVALDADASRVDAVSKGSMPFVDKGADDLLSKVLADGTFRCTTDPDFLPEAKAIVTVIGTPVDEFLNPEFRLMSGFVETYASLFRSGQLFVLRSTVYPGTTARVEDLLRRRDLDMDVAFCPERVAEGVALEELTALPQIVGGCTRRAAFRAEELFKAFAPAIIHLNPIAAELAKLFTNAWRYAQFAIANQFYMIANDHGIDFYEIHRAMTEGYPRAKWFCGAGFAAGPCLLKDTVQLGAFHNNAFFIGQAALMVNEGLPNYIVQRLAKKFPLHKMTVGILGMAFKANSDDTRNSLSFKLRKILEVEARKVVCSDPRVQASWCLPLEDTVRQADLLVIGVPHAEYLGMDFGKIPVVDVWNCIPGRLGVL
jgi:UDP-N-acetyl-D-mannosaminuronic acid dehydrogenase